MTLRAAGPESARVEQMTLPLPVQPAAGLPVLDLRDRGTAFFGVPIRSVLNSPESTGMGFWSLNPYVGCEFGCSYCYARDTHRWAVERSEGRSDGQTAERSDEGDGPPDGRTVRPSDLPPLDAFEHRILVKTEVVEVLRRTLDPARVGNTAIVIGTATDPYQPAERKFLLTRRLLEALLGWRGLTLSLTTKSALITRDLDLLSRLAGRHDFSVNVSLATVDPVLLRRLEPRTPLPHARLRAVRALAHAGIPVYVLLAPVLPGLTDGWTSLAGVMEAARGAGARDVVGMPLRLGAAAKARFLPLLRREFPDLAPGYERHYGERANPSRAYTRALARRLRLLRETYGFPRGPGRRARRRAETGDEAPLSRPRPLTAAQPPSESGGFTNSSSGGAVRTR